MTEFNLNKEDYDRDTKIIKDSAGFRDGENDDLLSPFEKYSSFIVDILNKQALNTFSTEEKNGLSSAKYHLGDSKYFLQLSSSNSDTDQSRDVKLKFIESAKDIFCVPETLDIDLNSESGKNIMFKMRDNILKDYSKGMGHLLAEACIRAECDASTPIFYSRIGYETVNKKYGKCRSNLSKDISNAVKSAKSSKPPKGIATVMVSCRYSSTGIIDDGHTICIAVSTNKFDENGELLKDDNNNPLKLTEGDCAIIDSSRAIISTIQNNSNHDNGIKEIASQLNQIIDVNNIKEYSLYPKDVQVGPKCSDYARRAYQQLSRECYTDIETLRTKSFDFANSIHKSVKDDYTRVLVKESNILRDIKTELSEKKPEENSCYPRRFGPRMSGVKRTTPPLAFSNLNGKCRSSPSKKTDETSKNPTSKQGSVANTKFSPVLKNLDFRPRFNPYVSTSNFSPTKLSKVANKSGHSIS